MRIRSTKITRKRESKIITNTDKGEAVAIMDTVKYIALADCQFSYITNYKKLKNDPTLQHHKVGNDTTNHFKKEKQTKSKVMWTIYALVYPNEFKACFDENVVYP